jgi:hypothetical protein
MMVFYVYYTKSDYLYQMFKGDLPREHDADDAREAPRACAWMVRHTTTHG